MTRLIRWQLLIFSVVTVVGISVMAMSFLRVPDKFGIGRYQVSVDLPRPAGCTRRRTSPPRVDDRRVTAVEVTETGARATLDLDSDVKVPRTAMPTCTAARPSASSTSTWCRRTCAARTCATAT